MITLADDQSTSLRVFNSKLGINRKLQQALIGSQTYEKDKYLKAVNQISDLI